MEKAIVAQDLRFSYQQGEQDTLVFENLNLTIEAGKFVAVLGHNGCGKSTLAKQFNAVLLPQGGKVYVYGCDTMDEEHIIDIRRTVGMVFQNPDNQMVANVVEEDVAFAPENLGVEPKEIRRRVDQALKTVGMYEYRTHAPHLLSGGQKQRVAIAGVLAMQPRCIVLDEPTAMLDPHGREEVLKTIEQLNREKGITVILITHHMLEAIRADRVIVMDEGKILLDGTPKEVFVQETLLHEAGLSVPSTTQLIQQLNEAGADLPLDALSTEECAQAIANWLGHGRKHIVSNH
ncbi:MAG: energy-coupling factor transporter ATPase [Ruminococcaceae bacterium]|nr:energy-coupling factor transporter ATPase [Oscillospiraceae bacterium]